MLAVVSGRPGSGKSTLASKLAGLLGCPLVSRDEINRGLLHTARRWPELPSTDELTKLTFDAFGRALAVFVSCGVTVVAEAAFNHPRWRIVLEPLLPLTDVKIIHRAVDADLTRERLIHRYLQAHNADPSFVTQATELATRDFEKLALPLPTLTVSTADGYDPPLHQIAAFVRL